MPTYEYVCRECATPLEVYQSIHDAPLTECPSCSGPLRKVFGNVGVVFKGSGFYRTDNRSKSRSGSAPAAKDDKSPAARADAGKSDSTKSESPKSDTAKSESKATSGAKTAAGSGGSSAA